MLSQVAGFAVCVRVMKFACIPHTQIPGSSRIFLDLLYHYDRVQDLYAHPPTLEAIWYFTHKQQWARSPLDQT